MRIPWRLGIKAAILSFLLVTVYLQHKHNTMLVANLDFANDALKIADEQIKASIDKQQQAEMLDKKYTEQLTYAKNEINQLRDDVLAGRKRLRIQARCVSNSTKASGMGDATRTRLTHSAESNYWLLRERINQAEKQIRYLQGFIMEMNH